MKTKTLLLLSLFTILISCSKQNQFNQFDTFGGEDDDAGQLRGDQGFADGRLRQGEDRGDEQGTGGRARGGEGDAGEVRIGSSEEPM